MKKQEKQRKRRSFRGARWVVATVLVGVSCFFAALLAIPFGVGSEIAPKLGGSNFPCERSGAVLCRDGLLDCASGEIVEDAKPVEATATEPVGAQFDVDAMEDYYDDVAMDYQFEAIIVPQSGDFVAISEESVARDAAAVREPSGERRRFFATTANTIEDDGRLSIEETFAERDRMADLPVGRNPDPRAGSFSGTHTIVIPRARVVDAAALASDESSLK